MNNTNVDVIIIGGGIVGLALACGLQGSNLRVAVLERNNLPEQMMSNMLSKTHVLAINHASKELLNDLGIWSEIINNVSYYSRMEVWDRDGFGYIVFDNINTNCNNLGYIVENTVIHNALWKKAQQYTNIILVFSTQIQKVIWNEKNAYVILQNGNAFTARLLVGADGANSWLRNEANIPFISWKYYHHALVTNVRTTEPHYAIARQVFYKNGIIAFLPLNDPYLCSIIWSLDSNKAKQMLKVTPKIFNQNLCVAFDNRLGLCSIESDRQIFPLIGCYAKKFASHRLILVGDAAHTIHLLAGQGVNLGFMDVSMLIKEIHVLYHANKDIGRYCYLRRYERNRKYNTAVMLAGIQSIYKIFSGSSLTKKLIRNIGMRIVNALPMVKLHLLYRAMGFNDLYK